MSNTNIRNIIADMTENSRWRPPKVSPMKDVHHMSYSMQLRAVCITKWVKPNMLNVSISSGFNLTK